MTLKVPTLRRPLVALAVTTVLLLALAAAGRVTVQPASAAGITPIGVVQGSVSDKDDARTHRSSYAPPTGSDPGDPVTIQGVIYQRTRARGSTGAPFYGFFIQNTAETADKDPNSSDGIFVFIGSQTSFGGYSPRVGDEIQLYGRVAEFNYMTQLVQPALVEIVRRNVPLDVELPAFETNPPNDLDDAHRYWERREGTRARVPAGTITVSGRNVGSTLDGEIWVARGDSPIAKRPEPYSRRVFRDAHPLDNVEDKLFDDRNGYRIALGSLGIKWTLIDGTAMIQPARTFQTVTSTGVGGVYFVFDRYPIEVEHQISLAPGPDPAANAPPKPPPAKTYTVVNFNVENLYDYRDDPHDGCDFRGNPGCPGVDPPFNYLPSSDAEYRFKLAELAEQIVSDLYAPDLFLVQEAEDQDICWVEDTKLACGKKNDADGYPDTLQELALAIAAAGGPEYAAVSDRDGADARGITAAFMYRTDRVELLPPDPSHPVLGKDPQVKYRESGLSYNSDVQNPKVLNAVLPKDVDRSTGVDGDNVFTRAPQVGYFRILGSGTDLYAVSNHFSSRPEERVGQRTEQALYNAQIVAALQTKEPGARAIVGGDLNVYPRPDDPFWPGHKLFPSDQLASLYDSGLSSLYDTLLKEVPESAYTYVFQGQAQTLDHQFMTKTQAGDLQQVRVAHINSDWPAMHVEDPYEPRGVSDHDPLFAVYASAGG